MTRSQYVVTKEEAPERLLGGFISSTRLDLIEERAIIKSVLLSHGCFAVAMEDFRDADRHVWSVIRREIDRADFVVLLVGGRYGSIDRRTGLSYTEREYRYAVKTGKPVIALIHASPDTLRKSKRETTAVGRKKLEAFTRALRSKFVLEWNQSSDLADRVSGALDKVKQNPEGGWIRAKGVIPGGGELLALGDCQKDLPEIARGATGLPEMVIDSLGLDLSVAVDNISALVDHCYPERLTLRMLMMPTTRDRLGPFAPKGVSDWGSLAKPSLARLRAMIESGVARSRPSSRQLHLEIREYTGVPMLHGTTIRARKTYCYAALCGYRSSNPLTYDWGRDSYHRIVDGEGTRAGLDLADLLQGLFNHHWHAPKTRRICDYRSVGNRKTKSKWYL